MDSVGFVERMETQLDKLGIAKQTFYTACGVSSSAVSQWRTGRTAPSQRTIEKIASFLHINQDYLVTGIQTQEDFFRINKDEETIIQKFRLLDSTGQTIVRYLLDAEVKRVEKIRLLESAQKAEVVWITLPRSLQKASAGHGCYLGPEEFEQIRVKETPLTRRASFIIQVQGNSMFPLYRDGDQLLVERAEDIEPGEIGIFTVDGDGYVKKRGEKELISLNSEYPNVPITENSWCNGRVIGVLLESDIK